MHHQVQKLGNIRLERAAFGLFEPIRFFSGHDVRSPGELSVLRWREAAGDSRALPPQTAAIWLQAKRSRNAADIRSAETTMTNMLMISNDTIDMRW